MCLAPTSKLAAWAASISIRPLLTRHIPKADTREFTASETHTGRLPDATTHGDDQAAACGMRSRLCSAATMAGARDGPTGLVVPSSEPSGRAYPNPRRHAPVQNERLNWPLSTSRVPVAPVPDTGTAVNWKVPETAVDEMDVTVMLPVPPLTFAAHC
jgi:hypothetical protein